MPVDRQHLKDRLVASGKLPARNLSTAERLDVRNALASAFPQHRIANVARSDDMIGELIADLLDAQEAHASKKRR